MTRASPTDDAHTRRRWRAQSEVLGAALLVAITVIASVGTVAVGASMLETSERTVTATQVEHALTQLDAQSGRVALGPAGVAEIDLGDTRDFRVDVEERAGWIRITHHDVTAGADQEIYNRSLGAVELERGDTTIAFQGGGVWRRDGSGSVGVSPPEFHYRDQTLTLPIVAVRGTGSASGRVTALVRSQDPRPRRVFPNASATYDAVDRPYANTVHDGLVSITVRSAYYEAWAEYWRTQTAGSVTVDAENETATVYLFAYGTFGRFDMPPEDESIRVRGIETDHAIENFTVVLAPDDEDAASFNNLQWSMYAERGSRELELHLRLAGRAGGDGSCKEQWIAATAYYSETNGNTYEGWHNDTAFRTECVDRDGDGTKDEVRLVANLTGDSMLEVTDLASDDLLHFNPSRNTALERFEFDEHPESVGWEPATFAVDCDGEPGCRERRRMGDVTVHYLSTLGTEFDLTIDDQRSDSVNEDESFGVLEYPGEGRITYLHVTENRISVELR